MAPAPAPRASAPWRARPSAAWRSRGRRRACAGRRRPATLASWRRGGIVERAPVDEAEAGELRPRCRDRCSRRPRGWAAATAPGTPCRCPGCWRRRRSRRRDRLAAEQDLAGIGLVDAGEDAHQRRLAGAVLADQPDHLVRPDLDRLTSFSAWTPGKRLSTLRRRAPQRPGVRRSARSLDDPQPLAVDRQRHRGDDHQALHGLLDARARCPSAPCRWRARRRSARRPASAARCPGRRTARCRRPRRR